ncbi:Tyrosine-protein phosphatase, partial [Lachnellula subtilissima]
MTSDSDEARALQPPFIPIDGLTNFRDIGGWPIQSPSSAPSSASTRVRAGILYRGPELTPLTPTGTSHLKSLHITTIFDLRSTPQISRAGGIKQIEGISRVWCPVFGEDEYTPEKAGMRYMKYCSHGTEGIVTAFLEILSRGAIPAFRPILLHLASPSPEPCLIHCTTGNNRSGVFTGILLSLLGVSAEVVAREYALSELGLRASRDAVVERLLGNTRFREVVGGERQRARRMVGARAESMLALLGRVEGEWGGAEGWV